MYNPEELEWICRLSDPVHFTADGLLFIFVVVFNVGRRDVNTWPEAVRCAKNRSFYLVEHTVSSLLLILQ